MLGLLLISAVVLCLSLLLFMADIPSLRAVRLARRIHGVPGWPVIGSLFEIMRLDHGDILDYFASRFKMYPRLTRLELVGIINIFLQEPEDIQVLFSGTSHIKKGVEYNTVVPWLREGLLLSNGIKWHTRRKVLTPAFHFKILKDSLVSINKNSAYLADSLLKSQSRPVNISDYITKCTLDIITETAMGVEIQAQTGVGSEYLLSVKTACRQIIERIHSVYLQKDWIFNLTPSGARFYRNLKTLHDFTKKIVKARKEERQNTEKVDSKHSDTQEYGVKNRLVFLDALLELQENDPNSWKDEDIYEEVDTFMFEGHDTVSSAITFILYLLGSHPIEQDMLVKEIESILGDSNKDITMEQVNKMVYMEKVIKESLRMYPSVPWISRHLTQDCVLEDGVVLPATSTCIVLPYLVHRNERFFPDPERFDPERFSEEECLKRHPYAYLPFSAGPRNCIGQKFAMLEMKVTLANILRRVRVEAVTQRDFKILAVVIIRPSEPLICKFHPRQSCNK